MLFKKIYKKTLDVPLTQGSSEIKFQDTTQMSSSTISILKYQN